MGFYIKLGNQKYVDFIRGSVTLKYAHVGSTFSFSGVFDPDNELHRSLFRPLNYPTIEIYSIAQNEKVLTGVILNIKTMSEAKKKVITFSGYSTTGVLMDCTIPTESYPLEFNGLTMQEIIEKLLLPFNLRLVIDNDGGVASEVIDEVTAETGQTVFSFLVELAAQRNLILSHNVHGNLVLTKTRTNVLSIATYRDEIPATRISVSTNGQRIHSSITAIGQSDIFSDNATEQEVSNSLVRAFRPSVVSQSIGNDNTAVDVAKNARSRELTAIRAVIDSDRWEWLNNDRNNRVDIASPNNIIDIISAENFLPNRTAFFVEEVTLNVDAKKESSVLSCVVPEVYNNEEPQIIFR